MALHGVMQAAAFLRSYPIRSSENTIYNTRAATLTALVYCYYYNLAAELGQCLKGYSGLGIKRQAPKILRLGVGFEIGNASVWPEAGETASGLVEHPGSGAGQA